MQRKTCILSLLFAFFLMTFILPIPAQSQEIKLLGLMPTYCEQSNSVALIFDDQKVLPDVNAFVNEEGCTMISADELAKLLNLQLDWEDNNQLQLSRNEKSISFRDNQYLYLRNNSVIPLDTSPFKNKYDLFIPLRVAAEEFGITVDYDADTKTVILYSQPPEANNQNETVLPVNFPQDLGLWGSIAPESELAKLWSNSTILGGYFTHLNNSPANRTNNIVLACNKINGTKLKPGGIFSFNDIVGQRTVEKGYLSASVFVGRKIVPGIGGGICQVSSTLYNNALESGLEIIERYPHSLPVTYIASGRDATVLWGGADLKFRNTLDYDLKVLIGVYENYVVALLVSNE